MRDPDERVRQGWTAMTNRSGGGRQIQSTRGVGKIKKKKRVIEEEKSVVGSLEEDNRGWKSRLLVMVIERGQVRSSQVSGGSDKGQVTPNA